MKTLLNPFSVELKKQPFQEIQSEPVYKNGDFLIYKLYEKHFLHTFKNIIFAERCGKNIEMIENIIKNTPPENGTGKIYHEFFRPKETIQNGLRYAKELNFEIR